MGPTLAAGAHVVGGYHLCAAALLDGEGQAVGRGERGIAAANRLLPDQAKPGGGPVRQYRPLVVVAQPAGAEEVGPIGRAGNRRHHGFRSGRRDGCGFGY